MNSIAFDFHAHQPRRLRPAENEVVAGHPGVREAWRKLTSPDRAPSMATRWHADTVAHEYSTPHESPPESFIVFNNALDDPRRFVPNTLNRQQEARSEDSGV